MFTPNLPRTCGVELGILWTTVCTDVVRKSSISFNEFYVKVNEPVVEKVDLPPKNKITKEKKEKQEEKNGGEKKEMIPMKIVGYTV